MLWAAFEIGVGVCPPCFYPFLVEMFLAAAQLSCPITFRSPRECDKTRRDWVGLLGGSCLTKNWNTHDFCRSTTINGATVLANCFRSFTDILLILEYGFNS